MIDEERNPDGQTEEEVWQALDEAVGVIRVDLLLELSEFAIRRGDNSASLTLAEQAVTEAKQESDAVWKARSLEIFGRRLYQADRYEEAAAAHMEAGGFFAEADDVREAANSYLHASWSYELNYESEQALNAVNLALSFAESLDVVPGSFYEQRATILHDLAASNGEVIQALSEARQSFRQLEDPVSVLRIDDKMAVLMLDAGDTKAAVSLLSDCVDVAESINDERTAYFSYRYGVALNRHGEHAEALKALGRSLEISLRQDTLRSVGAAYLEMARSHDGLKDPELALRFAAKARAHFDIGGDDRGARDADAFRATLLHGEGRFLEAAAINLTIAETGSNWEAFTSMARRADNLRLHGDLEAALQAASPGPGAIEEEFANSSVWLWRECIRALILNAMERYSEAQEIAIERLAGDMSRASAWTQAVFHELRGDAKNLADDEDGAAADWARAVAFYLAAGRRSEATRLSAEFLPDTDEGNHQ